MGTSKEVGQIRPSIDEVVAEFVEKTKRRQAAGLSDSEKHGVITISRMHGTGGAAIGQSVADELGFSFWHHNQLKALSEHPDAAQQILDSLPTKSQDKILEIMSRAQFNDDPQDSAVIQNLCLIFYGLHDTGAAVVLGRGGQFILKEAARVLRVRIVAGDDLRVATKMDKTGYSRKEVEQLLMAADYERQEFYAKYFTRTENQTLDYDLILNRDILIEEDIKQIIVDTYSGNVSQRTDSELMPFAKKTAA